MFSMAGAKSSDAGLPNKLSLNCLYMIRTGASGNVSKVVGAANVVSWLSRVARVAEV